MAIVVLTSCFVLAQEHDKPYSTDQVHSQTWTASTKALSVSGKVSDDGKRLISDIDTEWAVMHPPKLDRKGLGFC